MNKLSSFLTALTSALLVSACGAKSSGNGTAPSLPSTVSTTSSLVAAASNSSVAISGTVTFSVIGGTQPYTWSIQSGGGSLSSTTGASVVYTAGSAAGVAFLTVTDSVGATANASVTIIGSTTTPPSTSGNVCNGNYSATLGSYPASFQFATNGTALSGVLNYAGYQFPLVGTCTSSGISFQLTNSGDTFQGSFAANPSGAARAAMGGTYNNVYYGTTQTWTATPQ